MIHMQFDVSHRGWRLRDIASLEMLGFLLRLERDTKTLVVDVLLYSA